jgi:para-aminobenzoate synthetase component I
VKRTAEFPVSDHKEFKQKMLHWANQFSIFCLLDNQEYQFEQPAFECLLGAGRKREIEASAGNAFQLLKDFCSTKKTYLFGHLGYDLKNETEKLHSNNHDGVRFPDLYFFEPEIVLHLSLDKLVIHTDGSPEEIFSVIHAASAATLQPTTGKAAIHSRFQKQDYIEAVEKLKAHILRGDCYEVNFCQEFYAEHIQIDPIQVYLQLAQTSPNPFSALYKLKDRYCICASPERYLKKRGSRLISQPIKGTSPRNPADELLDNASRQRLLESEKERSENTMVVDLVRNDLSRICKKGSVKVTELHGIYSFPQVHQMISTVEGEIDSNTDWVDIIKATFPMGSMTGAPKKRVMELVEQYEKTKRGLFSGAVGYITPERDFDFNVVIRSMLYNQTARYLSYQAGSAITFKSNAEEEYAECLLKVEAIRKLVTKQ